MFLSVCMTFATILANPDIMPNMLAILRRTLTEGFTVIGWVVLWKPVELVINQLGLLRQNKRLYTQLLQKPI